MRVRSSLLLGTFVARRQRFFVDVALPSGEQLVAHCPNTGRLTGCLVPGAKVVLEDRSGRGRKLSHTWILVRPGSAWVAVDTGLAVPMVIEALGEGVLPSLEGYGQVHTEVAYGTELRSRIDVVLSDADRATVVSQGRGQGGVGGAWIEVKSTTLMESRGGQRVAMFPDAPSERGRKHLEELIALRQAGQRAVMVFAVGRADVDVFAPADHIDPAYGDGLRRALAAGVEAVALAAEFRVGSPGRDSVDSVDSGHEASQAIVEMALTRTIPVVVDEGLSG